MGKRAKNILEGLIITIIGIIVLGQAIGIWHFTLFRGWWTLFIIIPGIVSMFKNGIKIYNTAAVSIGTVLLLERLGVFRRINMWLLIIGIIIVTFGFKYMFASHKKSDNNDDSNRYI